MAQTNEGGAGPAKEEHLKLLQGTYDMAVGHIEGLAAELPDEAKKLLGIATTQLHAGFIVALHTLKTHLPDGE